MSRPHAAAHWSVLRLTPRVVPLAVATDVIVAAVEVIVAVVAVAVTNVVAAGAEVDAFPAASAARVFSHGPHRQGTVFPSASESESESESEMTMVTLSTSGTLHQCSFVEGLLEDGSPGVGLVGAKLKLSLSPVPSKR